MHRRWDRLESCLSDNYAWFELSDAQRLDLPAAQPLHAIEARLEHLSKSPERLL